ncbi:MAG TPA: zf-HC2 domain-containing protein [Povalibacter sp.]|nr:zf-HC2 domain-containing protein [Povalibacter sp.]
MTPSGRIPDTHAEAWAMLPFVANGRIAPEDREWVEQHLVSCAECRHELDAQRPLAQTMSASAAPFATSEQRAFAKLWTRIEAAENAMPENDAAEIPARVAGKAPRRTVRWLAAAVVVQAVGLALLGVTALKNTDRGGTFRTVTNAETYRGPGVRLVFAPDTTMTLVTDLLARHHLELIAGPGDRGVFTAAPRGASNADAMVSAAAALRQDQHVLFAEPLRD